MLRGLSFSALSSGIAPDPPGPPMTAQGGVGAEIRLDPHVAPRGTFGALYGTPTALAYVTRRRPAMPRVKQTRAARVSRMTSLDPTRLAKL